MERHEDHFVSNGQETSTSANAPPQYHELDRGATTLLSGTADTTDDGRIALNLDSKAARAFTRFISVPDEENDPTPPPVYSSLPTWTLPMNVVMQVVGSRGDVQPFVALGNELQKSGHRVRIATHAVFKGFVQSAGLEFYPIGGDPTELMAYMVKNPGLIPSMKTLKSGEINRKRQMIAQILTGCWKSCIEPDPDSGAPFVANAILANPVSFAHIHCAQALSVPLHMLFTMPWSPTRAFPHPLANLTNTSTDPKIGYYLSYGLVQALTWQGLADVINDFRKTLDLQVLPTTEAPFLAETLRIPYTYCWSPALVPKPKDWADHIDVSGFIFRTPLAYEPPAELTKFLEDGPLPIYIGFGSIVVEKPEVLLATLITATKRIGVRAIISRGWSKLDAPASDSVFFIDDCPHEWLFQHVAAVVHHGGAGTTACGLANGRPTAIVPFFGDQPFWGERIAAAGAGPAPIPHKQLNASNLTDAINFCLTAKAAKAAARIADSMRAENGVEAAAASFHRHLSADALRCDLTPSLSAVYFLIVKSKTIKISASAAETLLKHQRIKPKQLKLYEPNNIVIENRRWDPLTSAASSTIGQSYNLLSELNNIWYAPHQIRKEAEARGRIRALEAAADPGEGSSTATKANATKTSTSSVTPGDAAKMVGASAMSLPKLSGVAFKGFVIDMPYAITEGFRNAPKLYGEEVPAHEPVTDWKSGAIVGGKEFVNGMKDGLIDLFVQPTKGFKEDGARGAITGIGKGALGTATKLGGGAMALWSYPVQGLWRTVYDATHGGTKKAIFRARRVHDLHFAVRDRIDEREVLKAYDRIVSA